MVRIQCGVGWALVGTEGRITSYNVCYTKLLRVLDLAAEHAALDRGADGHGLVGVDALGRFLAEEVLDDLLDLRDAGRAADEDHLVDLARGQPGVLERLAAGLLGLLEQVLDQALERGAGQALLQVLGAGRVGGDERQVDVGLLDVRQLDLGLLGGLLEALQGSYNFV